MAEGNYINYGANLLVNSAFTFNITVENNFTIYQVSNNILFINGLFTTPSTVSSDPLIIHSDTYNMVRSFIPLVEAYSGNICGLLNVNGHDIYLASNQWQASKRVIIHAVVNYFS